MMKKRKFLIGILAAISVSAVAVMAAGCNPIDDIKQKINQSRCEHEWNDGEITKESTCTEKGELTKTCTLCEKVETEEIEFAKHVAVYVEAVAPTCTEAGKTDGTVCDVCGAEISGFQELPALGHIVTKDSAVDPTCLEDGLTEGEHCSRCDEVLLQQAIVPATGHNLVILEAVEPTCTTEGKTQGVWCDKCEEVFTAQEIAPALAHSDVNTDGVCDVCKEIINEEIFFNLFTDESKYTEVDVNVGDSVAGKVYRIYRPETAPTSIFPGAGYYMRLSNFVNDSRPFGFQSMPKGAVDYEDYIVHFVATNGYKGSGFLYRVYEDYVDFYLLEGTYIVGESIEATINEQTTIQDFSEGQVKELVLK